MVPASTINVTVVTPERVVLEKEAAMVVLTAADGEVGILPNHAPMVARLGAGELRITHKDGKTALFVDGGFAQVHDNSVTVLASAVRELTELKPDKLEAELAEATAIQPSSLAARKDRTDRINRINSALRVARRGRPHAH